MRHDDGDHWPFDAPRRTAVFCCRQIMRDGAWISFVSHDEDDGAWQFHPQVSVDVEDAMLVSFESVVRLDPTLRELADLPKGWCAMRTGPNAPWQRVVGRCS